MKASDAAELPKTARSSAACGEFNGLLCGQGQAVWAGEPRLRIATILSQTLIAFNSSGRPAKLGQPMVSDEPVCVCVISMVKPKRQSVQRWTSALGHSSPQPFAKRNNCTCPIADVQSPCAVAGQLVCVVGLLWFVMVCCWLAGWSNGWLTGGPTGELRNPTGCAVWLAGGVGVHRKRNHQNNNTHISRNLRA